MASVSDQLSESLIGSILTVRQGITRWRISRSAWRNACSGAVGAAWSGGEAHRGNLVVGCTTIGEDGVPGDGGSGVSWASMAAACVKRCCCWTTRGANTFLYWLLAGRFRCRTRRRLSFDPSILFNEGCAVSRWPRRLRPFNSATRSAWRGGWCV